MNLIRKCALATAAAVLGLGLVGVSAPSAHADSSWGCGGFCKTKPPTQP